MGLDESYDTIRTQIINMEPLPSLDRVYAIITQEESHRSVMRSMKILLHSGLSYSHAPYTQLRPNLLHHHQHSSANLLTLTASVRDTPMIDARQDLVFFLHRIREEAMVLGVEHLALSSHLVCLLLQSRLLHLSMPL